MTDTHDNLLVHNPEYYAQVLAFADHTGQFEQLTGKLKYLCNYGGDPTKVRVHLYKDFAPHSFTFNVERKKDNDWVFHFNGGLIYHGAHDNGGDGGPPTYSVNLTPQDGWSIHT